MPDLTPEEWMTEIDTGLDYRREYGREDAWTSLEKMYLNDPKSNTAVGPNLIFSMGDSLFSSLGVPDPEFLVSPEDPSSADNSKIVEATDNWLVRKMKLKRAIDIATINAYLFGKPILKIGYDSEFGWSPYFDIGKDNNLWGMTMTQFDKKGNRIEFLDTSPGMPWVRAVSPQDIVVPWGTQFLDDAPWIAHRVVRLTENIKKDPKYTNTGRLEARISMESFMQSYNQSGKRRVTERYHRVGKYTHNKKAAFNELWEIHDRSTGRIMVVASDYDKFLRRDIDAMQVCGMPFVSGSLVVHPRSFWTTPLAYYLGQIQKDQFDISTQAAKQRRISCVKFLLQKGVIGEDEAEKLISGNVGAIGVVDTNRPLQEVMATVPQGQYLDFIMQSQETRRDAREIVGMSRNQAGEFASGRHTARETGVVEKGSELRTSRRMGVIVDLYLDVIKKVNQVIFSYWKTPRNQNIGGEWVKFTGATIKGDYSYDVSLSTKRNVSIAQRKMEAMMTVVQLAQMGMPMNPNELVKYVTDAANDPAFERLFQDVQAGGGRSIPAKSQFSRMQGT